MSAWFTVGLSLVSVCELRLLSFSRNFPYVVMGFHAFVMVITLAFLYVCAVLISSYTHEYLFLGRRVEEGTPNTFCAGVILKK